ncbi:MAG: glycosyltransferase family protein [Clostridiales bacterium]|nr:glycosyltransferase family protein [Eubacteriales bacterium]MDH7566159.1 glycosyltransferase family protein [Clostridiales bacterium]
MKKTVSIIQARMGSTRLHGKVLLNICGKTVLEHVIDRVKQAGFIDEVVIAIADSPGNEVLAELAEACGVKYFRGSEEDVLSRYYYAARENKADTIVRITSDCPLIDPKVADEIIFFYRKNRYDMVSNAGPGKGDRTYPRGLDTEVFSFDALENAFFNASKSYQREHVTPFIYETSNRVFYYKDKEDHSDLRWTLDTPEDFELIERIYRHLYKGRHDFFYKDILNLLNKFPALREINSQVRQKKLQDRK